MAFFEQFIFFPKFRWFPKWDFLEQSTDQFFGKLNGRLASSNKKLFKSPTYYVRSKEFFKRKLINSVVVVFSLSCNCPLRAEFKSAESLLSCCVYVSGITPVWEGGGGRFKKRYGPYILRTFGQLLARSYF